MVQDYFPAWGGASHEHGGGARGLGGDVSGRDRGRGSVLGPGEEDWPVLVGVDGHRELSGLGETDKMDFLRLHLPGLHQALRGALDSFSTFVSYLLGDAVPTVPREARTAEELGQVASGKLVEEEAQEALEGLRGGQCERVGGSEEAPRCQEGSLAGERTWGWRNVSSSSSLEDGQDPEVREAGEEARTPSEAEMRSEAEPASYGPGSGTSQENQELCEQAVSGGELLRTWELEKKEEEEAVRATKPRMARGVESQSTWHKEPEGKADANEQKVPEDSKELEWVTEMTVTENESPGATHTDEDEERVVLLRGDQSARTQGTHGPEAESEGWPVAGREEAGLPEEPEREYEPGPGESILGVRVLEEARQGDQEEEEVVEEREVEASLQTQTLKAEQTEEAAEGQATGREAVGGQETGEGLEGQGRRDSAIGADGADWEEEVQAEDVPREKGSVWAREDALALDKEAEGELDLEAAPDARSEESFVGEMIEDVQTNQDTSKAKVAEGREPELMGDTQAFTKQPEEGQEESGRARSPSEEDTLSLEEQPRIMESTGPESEAWGTWRKDEESRYTQEGKADIETGGEEAAADWAVEVQDELMQESTVSEVSGWGAEEALSQKQEGSQGVEAETDQPLAESEPRQSQTSAGEAEVSWETDGTSREDWRLEEADRENGPISSLAAETVEEDESVLDVKPAEAGAGPEVEAQMIWEGGFRGDWHCEGREIEAGGGAETEEGARGENQGGQEIGLGDSAKDSAKEEAVGYDEQGVVETWEGEQAEVGIRVAAEESHGMDSVTVGSQEERAEGATAIMEAEGLLEKQKLLEEESRGGQEKERGDHPRETESPRLQGVENIPCEGQQTETQKTEPADPEDVHSQEELSIHRVPEEAVPDPWETPEAANPADAHSSWSEVPLPGSLLDVSVPRSRVLLARSSSQRRSRPSFRRTPAHEQQKEPPSSQEEPSVPEPSPLQPEEVPEPSPPKPEGTPVPARKRPMGHGFGLAHPGMMQELQARLGRQKPQ